MVKKENKSRFWTTLSVGVGAMSLGLISFFYNFNTDSYLHGFKGEQEGHHRYQNMIKSHIRENSEAELLAIARLKSLPEFESLSTVSSSTSIATPVSSERKQIETFESSELLVASLIEGEIDREIQQPHTEAEKTLETRKNPIFRMDGIRTSTLFDISNHNGFENEQLARLSYPDPVRRRPDIFIGGNLNISFVEDRPNFRSVVAQHNASFQDNFIEGNILRYNASMNQSMAFGLVGGIRVNEVFEFQTGVTYSGVRGQAVSVAENEYLTEYTQVEWIVSDNEQGGTSIENTVTRNETIMDTLKSQYTSNVIELPLNLRIHKQIGNFSAFASAGVALAVYNKSNLTTKSSNTHESIQTEKTEVFNRETYSFGIGVDYEFLQGVNLRIEPSFRVTPGNMNSINQRTGVSGFGLNAGVFYRF